MVKNNSVILCFTQTQAKWALNYLKLHPLENIKILSPTIAAQLYLRQANYPPNLYYEVEEFVINDTYKKNNIYHQAIKLSKIFEDKFSGLKILNFNLFTLHIDNLVFIYADILHKFRTYRNLVKIWRPNKVYVPKQNYFENITGSGTFFSLAFYIQHFFNENLTIVEYSSNHKTITGFYVELLHLVRNKIYLLALLLYKFILIIPYYLRKRTIVAHSRPRILMQTGGTITAYYYGLFKKLEKNFEFSLITYKLQLHQQLPLFKKKIYFVNINSFDSTKLREKVTKITDILAPKLNELEESNLYLKKLLPVFELRKAIINQTIVFFQKNLSNSIRKILLNKNILDKIKPKVIINSHDPSITGSSLVLPAKFLQIPSILLLHGLPIGKTHPASYSDYVAVWGRKTKEHFVKHSNIKPQSLVSLGFPKVDEYIEKLKSVNRLKTKLNSASVTKIGLLLTSYFPSDSYQAKFIYELFSSISRSKYKLMVNYRLHEGFQLPGIHQLGKHLNVLVSDKSLMNLDKFILVNDVILSWDTSAILWAMFYRKPIFHTNPNWSTTLLDTRKYKACWYPKNANHFLSLLERYIENPEIIKKLVTGQVKFLTDYCGSLDGKASERTCEFIKKIAERKLRPTSIPQL